MDVEAVFKLTHAEFGVAVSPVVDCFGFRSFEVDPGQIDKVCAFLKNHVDLDFDCLLNLTGVDRPDAGKIQLVYELTSFKLGHDLVIKADTDRKAPVARTVEGVWRAANWLEREVFDLLGVDFSGHSDLRRILLPDDWVGSPLRKDYVEAPDYHGISTVRESILNIPGRQ